MQTLSEKTVRSDPRKRCLLDSLDSMIRSTLFLFHHFEYKQIQNGGTETM